MVKNSWNGKDRRRGNDGWVVLLNTASIGGWVGYALFLIVVHYAKPERSTGIQRYHNIEIRDYWDLSLAHWAAFILLVCTLLGAVTLWVNMYRSRRKGDLQKLYGTALAVLSAVSLISLMVNLN